MQTVDDQRVTSIQSQLASLTLQEAPVLGAFNPGKGDIVLAQFSVDNSWNRAMVRLSPTWFAAISFLIHFCFIPWAIPPLPCPMITSGNWASVNAMNFHKY